MKKQSLLKLLNFWPPFLGAGIKVDYMSPDYHEIKVSMKLRFWNRNYVNTHYGGSLYSMTDPFYMLMLMQILGNDYVIWDKAASINFKRPGKGKVRARFHLTQEMVQAFKVELKTKNKIEPILLVKIIDENDQVIAEVEKVLYIKKKN